MNKKLKPCPFCGGEVAIALGGNDDEQWYFITRGNGESKCTCKLFMNSDKFYKDDEEETKMEAKSDLINQWNKRFIKKENR